MPHSLDHDHHSHDHGGHEHDAAPGGADDQFDAANQSLSDALKASFRILKGIMLVLVLLYLFSNVRKVDVHEQALQLRMGRLLPRVYEAEMVWAFPFPLDEIVPLPTRRSNDLLIDSHTFERRPEEVGKPLSFIARGMGGLNPALDGALMTSDGGLVHVQWKVTYKFDDVKSYVSYIKSQEVEAAETLIRRMIETVGIHVATGHTAEEMIRTRVEDVQNEMKARVNERLAELGSGIVVTRAEMAEPTPPIPVRDAFDATQQAENAKQKRINDAQQERTKVLSEAAGAAYQKVIQVLDVIDRAPAGDPAVEGIRKGLDKLLETEVEGQAGRLIKDAGAQMSIAVSQMQGDVELYQALLPEYKRNPALLIARLWEQTRQQIFAQSGVTKLYRPHGSQLRLRIPFDPELARLEEERRLKKTDFDVKKLRPEHLHPVGMENE
jgi:membrane protease subunit HflK